MNKIDKYQKQIEAWKIRQDRKCDRASFRTCDRYDSCDVCPMSSKVHNATWLHLLSIIEKLEAEILDLWS